MKLSQIPVFAFIFTSILSLSSCISTDTIDPDTPETHGDELVIRISAPSDVKTRSHDGFYLRYVAKVYRVQNSSTFLYNEYYKREEILDGANDKNEMKFYVEPNYDYNIVVFADYIPDTTIGDDGYYNDYFYNTKISVPNGDVEPNDIVMYATPGDPNSTKVSPLFFNNDNYDCFSAIKSKETKKDGEPLVLDMTLKRVVSKVIFRDNSNPEEAGTFSKITFTELPFLYQYTMANQQAWQISNKYATKNLVVKAEDIAECDEDGFLYFYSFANNNNNTRLNFGFSIEIEENDKVVTVDNQWFQIQQNRKTIILGSLIPKKEDQGQEGQFSDEDAIIVHPTVIQEWDDDSNHEI